MVFTEDSEIGLNTRQFNVDLPSKTIFLGDKWLSKVIRRVGFHKGVNLSKLLLTSGKDRILFHLTIHLHNFFFIYLFKANYCHAFTFFEAIFYDILQKNDKG